MSHFFIWIASFFILVIFIFWRYMGLAWFTWKDKDFLQVQSKHCRRLRNGISHLEKCLEAIEASSKAIVLNKNQCVHLFGKLILTMKGINQMLSSAIEDLKFQSIFEELCYLQKKVETIGKNCRDEERWCYSAIFQLQNKETFRELLLDLKCCYDTAREMYLFHHPNYSSKILSISFDAPTYDQVLEDGQELKQKLELVLRGEISEDYELVQHLLLRLRNLDRVDGGDLDALEVPNDFKTPKLIKRIGKGGYGDVYKSNWLGLECATKVLAGDLEYLMNFRKEAGILAGLSHPNLVQFFGCGISKKVDETFEEDEASEMHLVMELMDSNLSTILKEVKRPLPYQIAVDIVHQIAKGVYYLHDMQVAHLDLKPDNVLSKSLPMENLKPCCIFKVMDYGTSQLEVCSNPKHPAPSKYTIGTLRYMAPEMIEGSKTPRHLFRADVWSFAMICSEILFGKVPYCDLDPIVLYDQMKDPSGPNLRPTLPNDCKGLTMLIQECWSQDPLQRPTFSNICDRLTSLKKSFLKEGACALRDSKSIMNHVPRVHEPIALPKEIQIDLDRQLSKAKVLLKMKYVGIIGMGGIGKTTLAKAIIEDAAVNSLFHASCFVAECRNYQNSYKIICEILPKLGNHRKPKSFGDAQEMMKELLIRKKVLLILDDIKDETQVLDIVPPVIVQTSKGTTIIIMTRNWSMIKSFVGIRGKLNVELLDEKAATTLFMSHLGWNVASMSLDFVALCKHVVKACNGLPLSLKVVGSFLRNKERLRGWERALQRMARRKNLDGDKELWNTLQISFDGLNDGIEKRMFLDVACFFCRDVYPCGISKEMILSMWSKDGIFPVGELERLIDMSLLKVNADGGILEMHDQLRDMGRMIAKDTRIWKASMMPENGFSSKMVEVLEGISLQGTMICHMPLLEQDQSLDFEKLRILILGSDLDNLEAYVDNLGFLFQVASQCSQLEAIIIGNSQNFIGLPHTLPASIVATLNTRISDLCGTHSSLKILDLKELKFLKQLPTKFASSNILLRLSLSSCSNLTTFSKKIGSLTSLTTLNLSGCSSLVALPKEVGNLSFLTTLDMSECLSLVALPKEVGRLHFLTTLDLSGCSSLEALPKEVENMFCLTTLHLKGCSSLVALPKEVGNLFALTTLELSWCSSLVALPEEVGHLSSLTTLNIFGCSSLVALPKEVGNLSFLTTLDLSWFSSLKALPTEVGNLSFLTIVRLNRCSSLVTLPKEVGNLSSLTTLDLSRCSNLVALPKEVGNLSSLTTLDLSRCSNLVALPKEIGNLSSLTTLDLNSCSSLMALPKEVGNLSSLTTFNIFGCSSLVALPNEVGYLSDLTIFYFKDCLSLATLPKEVGYLFALTTLDLKDCSTLKTLPKEVGNLSSLTTLKLRRCLSLEALPKEVGNLSSLITLDLCGCSNLEALPKGVGNLSSLITLDLCGCSSLDALPKEVGNLSSLITLNLWGCSSLEALPKEVGNLFSLTTVRLNWCSSLVALPKEVGILSSLKTLDLSGCSSLMTLPKELGNLSFLTTMRLNLCSSLTALPEEVGNLSSLKTVNLNECHHLVALPKELGNLSSLTTLDLSLCSSLVALPKEIGNLSSLTFLDLRHCLSLMALPNEVGNLSSLTALDLNRCSSLVALPEEVGNLSFLTYLYLRHCSSLMTLPNEVGNLSSLTTLDLNGCSSLVALPKEVGYLSSLTTLDLSGCSSLVALPKEVGYLSSLTTLDLSECSSLVALPKEVGNLSSLTTMKLRQCSSLVALLKEVGNLSSLTTLDLEDCSSLVALPKEVGNLLSLKTLNLEDCSNLVAFPKELGNLSSLTTLYLSGCSSLTTLPKEVENLFSLTISHLRGCSSLMSVPKKMENLTSLTIWDFEKH